MDRRHSQYPIPADEDPVVHGYLTAIGRLGPRPGFAERVLVNVWQPHPRWLRDARAAIQSLIDSGRIWFLVGAVAAGSLIPQVTVVGLAAALTDDLAPYAGPAVAALIPRLGEVATVVATVAYAALTGYVGAFSPFGMEFATIALIAFVAVILCGLGLYRTMQTADAGSSRV